MALQINKPSRRVQYILKADRDSAQRTEFELRPLTRDEMGQVHALTTISMEDAKRIAVIKKRADAEGRELTEAEIDEIEAIEPTNAESLNALMKQHALLTKFSLVSIKGLLDYEGKPIEMSPAEFLDYAPGDWIYELGSEALAMSRLSGDRVKK